MPRYAAFLRGINLGNRRVKNEQLQDCFVGLGFGEVDTFRASGNVIFSADEPKTIEDLSRRIEDGLADGLGFQVTTFLRSAEQMNQIASYKPFADETVASSAGKLQVMLLATQPPARARTQVLELASEEDLLAIHGSELYWLPNGRITDSTLDLKTIAKALGDCTQRTKGTIEQIAAKHFAV
ncbi:MAG TPA: DUF1697 domain-containing protein [Solirubrobacteraceae bacterium]|jgi:uncharacterized protein (DUF1697 family)